MASDSPVTLLAHSTVLTMEGPVFGAILFTRDNSEPADDRTYGVASVLLGVQTWTGMGEPTEITVTVKPGDALNNDKDSQ